MAGAPKGKRRRGLPERDVMVLTELDQIKVLADPLRIRILEELAEERTTKQVAERIGEKPTKLYHHVEALERVGLIALTRTRQNRGTLEKYYQAVARSFRADASAFTVGSETTEEERGTLREVIRTIFHSSAAELEELVDAGCGEAIEDEGVLSFVEIRAPEEDVAELRRRLSGVLEWLEGCAERSGHEPETSFPRYRLTMALYPLDRPEKKDKADD
jgi:DNA-binding transcriptional ArsR family regulator